MKLSFPYSGKRQAARKPVFQSKQDGASPKYPSDTVTSTHSFLLKAW